MTTYAILKTNIQAWAENDDSDFTDQIDTIIDFAEKRILKEADLTIARKESSATAAVAQSATVTTSFPSDVVILRWVQVTSGNFLIPKDESFIKEFNTNSDAETSPKFYSWLTAGTQLAVAPAPSVAITLDIGYTYRITGLSDSNTTNWISINAPDVLLYACMVEAQAFMKEEQREEQRWMTMYQQARDTLKIEEERRRRTDEYRTPEKR